MHTLLRTPALVLLIACTLLACSDNNDDAGADATRASKSADAPVIGFVQFVEDATLDEAKRGFYDALSEAGYSEDSGTVRIIYRNAQGDQPALNQILDYFVSERVDAIAANTTLAMITAANKTRTIPIFMMVAPSPEIAKLTTTAQDGSQVAPPNLFGVYETLAYIDTSIGLIPQVLPKARRIGTIYNSSEPNSVNSFERLRARAAALGLEVVALPAAASSETQQVVQALLNRNIDVFFALPDNIIFSSFETVHRQTMAAGVPIVTSEAGLVKRGAFIAYGADFYQWGHQAGQSAVPYLNGHDPKAAVLEQVRVRKRTFNPTTTKALALPAPAGFEPLQ